MIELRSEANFTEEPLGAEANREFAMEELQRDETIVLEITCEVDRSDPAAPELALDRVAVGQGGLEASRRGLAQRDLSDWGPSRLYPSVPTDQSQPSCCRFCYRFPGKPAILGRESGHRCSVSDRFRSTAAPALPTLNQESPGSSPGRAIKPGNDFRSCRARR
jgi:hypothetical protein